MYILLYYIHTCYYILRVYINVINVYKHLSLLKNTVTLIYTVYRPLYDLPIQQ